MFGFALLLGAVVFRAALVVPVAAVAVSLAAAASVRGTGVLSTFASFGTSSGHVRAAWFAAVPVGSTAFVAAVSAIPRYVADFVAKEALPHRRPLIVIAIGDWISTADSFGFAAYAGCVLHQALHVVSCGIAILAQVSHVVSCGIAILAQVSHVL